MGQGRAEGWFLRSIGEDSREGTALNGELQEIERYIPDDKKAE